MRVKKYLYLSALLCSFLFSFSIFSSEKKEPQKTTVVLLHPGPAQHWSEFVSVMRSSEKDLVLLAAEQAAVELERRGLRYQRFYEGASPIREIDPEYKVKLAKKVAGLCMGSDRVIVEAGHLFASDILKEIKLLAPRIEKVVYYDNPEPYVPGGYSTSAAKAIQLADSVLFANKKRIAFPLYQDPTTLIPMEEKKIYGLGYYPLEEAYKIKDLRASPLAKERRKQFFEQHGIVERGQRVLVYFGGANEEYYSQAFPAFSQIMISASHLFAESLVIVQQHPRAREEDGNRDTASLPKDHPFLISTERDSDKLLSFADVVLYYQTSASAKFLFGGIPAIQIGHQPYRDAGVVAGLVPSVTDLEGLLDALENAKKNEFLSQSGQDKMLEQMGVSSDWQQALHHFFY